ncbi:5'-nucleotidase, partial [Streptomyces sp. NPDC006385]
MESNNRLVIGIASSALFDLAEADAVFREQGEEVYR